MDMPFSSPGRWAQSGWRRRLAPGRLRCYYEILGLHRRATEREIVRSYHALARMYHPDSRRNQVGCGDIEAAVNVDDQAVEADYGDVNLNHAFAEIGEAYRVLRDPDSRAHYDLHGRATVPPVQRPAQPRNNHDARGRPSSTSKQQLRYTRKEAQPVRFMLTASCIIFNVVLYAALSSKRGPKIHKFDGNVVAQTDLLRRQKTPKNLMKLGAELAKQKSSFNRTHHNFSVYTKNKNGTLTLLHQKGDPRKKSLRSNNTAGTKSGVKYSRNYQNVPSSSTFWVSNSTKESPLQFPSPSSLIVPLRLNEPVTNGTHYNVTLYIKKYERGAVRLLATHNMGDLFLPTPRFRRGRDEKGFKYWIVDFDETSYGPMVEWERPDDDGRAIEAAGGDERSTRTDITPLTNGTHYIFDVYHTTFFRRCSPFFINIHKKGEPIIDPILFDDYRGGRNMDPYQDLRIKAKKSAYWIYNGTYGCGEGENDKGGIGGPTSPLIALPDNRRHLINNGTHYVYDVYSPLGRSAGFKILHRRGELVRYQPRLN